MKKIAQLSMAAALAVIGYGAVQADEATPEITRANVVAELHVTRASGALEAMHGEDSGSAWLTRQGGGGSRARGAVRAQMLPVRGGSEIDVTGEDSGSFALARATQSHGLLYAGPDSDRAGPEVITEGKG